MKKAFTSHDYSSSELSRLRTVCLIGVFAYVGWGLSLSYLQPGFLDPEWIRYSLASIATLWTLWTFRSKNPNRDMNYNIAFIGFSVTLQSLYVVAINSMNMMSIVGYFIFFSVYLTFIQSRKLLYLYIGFCFSLTIGLYFATPAEAHLNFMFLLLGHIAIAFSGVISKLLQFKMLEQLSESEKQKSLVFANIMDGIIMRDGDGTVIYSNPAAEEVLAISGRRFHDRNIDSEDWGIIDEKGQPIKNEDLPIAITMREKRAVRGAVIGIRNHKSELKWLSVNNVPFFDTSEKNKQKMTGLLSTFQDITSLKKVHELNIAQAAQLAEVARLNTLGEMAGGMAHEINTPLTIIKLRAEQVIDDLNSESFDREKIMKHMKSIDQTVGRISEIIKGLKSFSRDTSEDPMDYYSVKKIIDDTFSLCQQRFASYGVRLELRGEKDSRVYCRPEQISQVLLNMLNNSFDAIENLSEKWIRVELSENEQAVTFKVIDSGKGIKPEIQDKLMQPFFTTKEIGKGTGLGLSISQGIIENHGGKIQIDRSSPNTCFVFNLRRYQSNKRAG